MVTNVNGGRLNIGGTGFTDHDADSDTPDVLAPINSAVLTSPTVEVNAGGTLGGHGTVIGVVDVNDGGTLSPGNSIGTLGVVGNVNFADRDPVAGTTGGIFEAEVDPFAADLLEVFKSTKTSTDGKANLNGTAHIIFEGAFADVNNDGLVDSFDYDEDGEPTPHGSYLKGGKTYTLITAQGGVYGTFDDIVDNGLVELVQDDPSTTQDETVTAGLFKGVLQYLPNSVILTTIPVFGDGNFGPLTLNQQATADYLDLLIPFGVSVAPNDDLAYVAAQLGLDPNIPAGLDDLHPEWYNGYTEAGLYYAKAGVQTASDRLRGARNGVRVNAQVVKFGSGSAVGNSNDDRFSFWVQGGYGKTDINRDSRGFLGYNMDHIAGFMGLDYQVNSQIIVGVMGGFGNTEMDVKDRLGEGDIDHWQVAGYATFYGKRWFVDVVAGYGDLSIDTNRDITFGALDRTAHAKHDGDVAYAHIKAGYSFHLDDGWFAIPNVGFTWANVKQGHVTETGAGSVSLDIDRQGTDSLRLETNLVVTKAFMVGNSRSAALVPYVRIGMSHELENNLRPITSRFVGQSASFTVWGEPGANTVFTFGLGVNWVISSTWSVFFDFSSELGGDYTNHIINGGVRFRF